MRCVLIFFAKLQPVATEVIPPVDMLDNPIWVESTALLYAVCKLQSKIYSFDPTTGEYTSAKVGEFVRAKRSPFVFFTSFVPRPLQRTSKNWISSCPSKTRQTYSRPARAHAWSRSNGTQRRTNRSKSLGT